MTDTTLREIAYKLADGQKVQAVVHQGDNELFRAMAAFAGRSGWTNAYSVVFDPGKNVTEHDHPEDVVLYYPDGANGTPIIVEGEAIYPEPGEMLFVPKHARHEVPFNATDKRRISIALKVTDEEA